jgi:Na+/H+-dicarboxylate symporter
MLTLILVGVVIGFIVGTLINGTVNDITDIEEKRTVIMLIGFPGELFMNMLKLLILPLIVASLVTAVASLDAEATAKIGRRTIIYYLSTTFIAVILGIVLVTTIKPGEGGKPATEIVKEVPKFRNVDSFLDLIRCVKIQILKMLFIRILKKRFWLGQRNKKMHFHVIDLHCFLFNMICLCCPKSIRPKSIRVYYAQ